MRATLADVARHPTWLGAWWDEWPFRRNVRVLAWWRWLLFDKGQGWLRWGIDYRIWQRGYLEPPEEYQVAPPLRRLAMVLRYRATWPLDWRDDDRKRGDW